MILHTAPLMNAVSVKLNLKAIIAISILVKLGAIIHFF